MRRPEGSDGASAKEAAPFNAHSPSSTGSGLVQNVFPLPARIRLRSPSAEVSAPRRQGKNAVRYAVGAIDYYYLAAAIRKAQDEHSVHLKTPRLGLPP
jgi:hypothetical protein